MIVLVNDLGLAHLSAGNKIKVPMKVHTNVKL